MWWCTLTTLCRSAVCGTKVKWCPVALPLQVHVLINVFALVVIFTISDVPALPLSPTERVQPCLSGCGLQLPSVAFIKRTRCTQPLSVYTSYSEERCSLRSRDVFLFLVVCVCVCRTRRPFVICLSDSSANVRPSLRVVLPPPLFTGRRLFTNQGKQR